MLRKPRNARTDRLTDWRLFFQIYLVSWSALSETWSSRVKMLLVPWTNGLALRDEHVVCIHASTGPRIP
jgi:hypothetical protein